ncbi:MAG: hypothetical protein ABIP32_07725 [Chthoniobacterales bacterium]
MPTAATEFDAPLLDDDSAYRMSLLVPTRLQLPEKQTWKAMELFKERDKSTPFPGRL